MKRMIPILLMMTLLLTGCAVPKPATEANTYRQITMQEAVEMMEKEENYIILDVRTLPAVFWRATVMMPIISPEDSGSTMRS